MLKRIITAVIFIAALAVSALFTSLNPGEIELDLAFVTLQTPLGLAFVLALAAGWALGILSALFWVMRISNERRRLRAELKKTSPVAISVRDERA